MKDKILKFLEKAVVITFYAGFIIWLITLICFRDFEPTKISWYCWVTALFLNVFSSLIKSS